MGQEQTRDTEHLSDHSWKRVSVLTRWGEDPHPLVVVGYCAPQDGVWHFHDICMEVSQECAAYGGLLVFRTLPKRWFYTPATKYKSVPSEFY